MNENSLTNSAEEFFKNSEQLDTKFNVLIKKTLNKKEKVIELFKQLRLPDDIAQFRASSLSMGQQQRVAVARALIGNPSLIIADEPTSSLDADAQKIFLNLMFEQISENNSTLLMVSHDKSLSNQFDRLIDINEILIREDKSCY